MKSVVGFVLTIVLSFVAATPVREGAGNGIVQFSYIVHLKITRPVIRKNPDSVILKHITCAGVIIRPDVVLTAAHCIGDTKQKPAITAWAGVADTNREKGKGQKISVKYYKQHEKFVDGFRYGIYNPNDIAVLWLEKPFTYDEKRITQAVLPQGRLKAENKLGWAAGWGFTESGKISNILQKTELRAISQENCEHYFSPSTITDKVICAISDNENSIISQGDLGGPFVFQDKVVGLASFVSLAKNTNKKGQELTRDPQKPTVYTDIFKYIDWINKTLENGRPVKPSKKKSKN